MAAPAAFAADLEGRVLKIGTDATYPPMETVDETTGEIVGFDVDVMNAICEKVNCVPNFVNTAWDGIFAALQQGEFDLVISGVSQSPRNAKKPWISQNLTLWSARPSCLQVDNGRYDTG